MICSIEGCGRGGKLRNGLCNLHDKRRRRHGDPLAGRTPDGEPEAWIERHVDYDGDDSLIWPFGRHGRGYGPHREMCRRAHGEPPTSKHEAAHSCGRGHEGCIHPGHLRWATPVENQADRIEHGTTYRGDRHWRASITEVEAREIRGLELPTSVIARRFGVSNWTVRAIKTGRSWGWLT